MISYSLIANGKHNPYLATPIPEHMMYPISQHCEDGIDLDYSALLLGERFIIDDSVFDDIITSRKEYFRPMQKSFRELKACGLLDTIDYSEFLNKNTKKIIDITSHELYDVEKWLYLAQKQWSTLKQELYEFQKTYGSLNMANVNTTNIGIESWLTRSDQVYNRQLRDGLYLLFEGKNKIENVGIDNVRGSLEFIVAQIIISDLVSYSTRSPVLDWDDSKDMYDRIFSLRWGQSEDEIGLKRETNKLFNVLMPDLKPNNINQVIRFISDNKAVTSLRMTLIELISNGETVNRDWLNSYINHIFAADIAYKKKSSIFSFLGTVAGWFTGPWFQGATLTGTMYLADKLLFHKEHQYDWYYTLQKSVSN